MAEAKPAEYAHLTGDALVERVMRDRDLSRAGALETIMLWERPEGDVIELGRYCFSRIAARNPN